MNIKLILTYGLPASGKTTWAENQTNYCNICKDDIRFANPKIRESEVIKIRNQKTRDMLQKGQSVIWSDTNLNPIHKETAKSIAKEFNAIVEIKDFTDISLEECLKRDIGRPKAVGDQVIKKMYYQYLEKPIDIEYNPDLPDCYIFDIDGTLAIKSPERGYFEWGKVGLDLPNSHIIKLCNRLSNLQGTEMFIFSGRDEICKDITLNWLDNYLHTGVFKSTNLFMRPQGNQEDDRIIKEKMYKDNILGKYNVVGIFDDRPKVCRMWRSLGLPVFQVGNPDVDF